MFDLTLRRQGILGVLSEDAYSSRKDIMLRLNPEAAAPIMPDTDQQSLALLLEAGLIEARQEPGKRPRWEYRRTPSGTRLLRLLNLCEPFNLTSRRLNLVQVLSEKFYLSRRELFDFLSPGLLESGREMSDADEHSLTLLAAAGFVDARQEPERPNKARERWLYRRTEKGTQLLEILGIEPEG
jgi:DNA-binding PadR family transcriptional regulator